LLDPATCIQPFDPEVKTLSLVPLSPQDIEGSRLDAHDVSWIAATGFDGKVGSVAFVPGEGGDPSHILIGTGDKDQDIWWLAASARKLPVGSYRLEGVDSAELHRLAVGWCLEQYKFARYKSDASAGARILVLPEGMDPASIAIEVEAASLVRDLVNTPAEDMGPAHLQDHAEALAERFGGTCSTIVGDDLLDENFPTIHAVGRAASEVNAPRLIDLRWGREGAKKLTLVGKGVCFDTGGLDLKPAQFMALMKKDMGGAAHALGLAQMVMARGLDVDLRVLVPAVENSVSGNAFRPGDVIKTRKGLSVEIGNTDAEGRLVLCDALSLASEESPEILIDFATLTGAARVALGPDLPATYTNDDGLWRHLENGAAEHNDPLWRMPLWADYDQNLASDIADMNNISEGSFAGSITAALYLQRFVDDGIPWVHFDVFAWNPKARPGRPKGGAAQGLNATYSAIAQKLGLDG